MLESELKRARVISSVAATVISLACGTNVSPLFLTSPFVPSDPSASPRWNLGAD